MDNSELEKRVLDIEKTISYHKIALNELCIIAEKLNEAIMDIGVYLGIEESKGESE